MIFSVLIVEDSPITAAALCQMVSRSPRLRGAGVVHSVKDAIRMTLAAEPDAVVLDLSLSDGSGLDLLRELQMHPRLRTRVLVLSAESAPEVIAMCLQLGAARFLGKPAEVATVERALLDVLRPDGHGR